MNSVVASIPINISLQGNNSDVADLGQAEDVVKISRGISFTHGTGANQANVFFADNRGITSTGETLDLNDTVLLDAFGVGLAMTKLKALYIQNQTDAAMTIGGAAATQLGLFTAVADSIVIPPGGDFFWSAPDASGLDCSSNDSLKITHAGAGTQNYDIIVVGVR